MLNECVLIRDDDGHWYVCPAERADEAAAYFESAAEYWADPEADGDPPPEPDYLEGVGGTPSLVRFTGYTIG